MRRRKKVICMLILASVLSGCSQVQQESTSSYIITYTETVTREASYTDSELTTTSSGESTTTSLASEEPSFSLEDIPTYSNDAWTYINDNIPYFTEEDYTTEAFESYGELDGLGRCTVCFANVCQELMPIEDRESISEVEPTGWHNEPYDFVDGGWLYNRCHLIGFQLTGENANECNLITGTRYLNIDGMLDWENLVAEYVHETDNHVLYRITPIFDGDNLLASGVEMEGWSVEDDGEGVCFNIYAYNVQPGVAIDYATGENWEE